MRGLVMSNADLAADHPMAGDFVAGSNGELGTLRSRTGRDGRSGRWWNSPLLFWDQFSKSGSMGSTPDPHDNGGRVVCLQKTIQPGQTRGFRVSSWAGDFPIARRSGADGRRRRERGRRIIGNYYAERFKSGWDAVCYAAEHLKDLEAQTRAFTETMRESTIPAAVKEAASANLSTLATTTCFRTADGEFHGFEGSDDTRGCCLGNCTHVWNYETATPFLFPVVCAVAAPQLVRILDGRCGRDAFPPDAAGRQGALGIRGGGRTDGADHPCVDRLEDFRRRCAASRAPGRA